MTIGEEQAAFYFELGIAMTQWAEVERSLLEIATASLHKTNQPSVTLGFFNIENFRGKLAFVDGVLEAKSTDARVYKEGAVLKEKANNLAATRNKLAHNHAMGYGKGPPGRRYALIPWVNKSRKTVHAPANGVAPSHALCVRDIAGFTLNFRLLHRQLANLACKIARQPKRFSGAALRQENPPEIHEITARMHAMLQPQPRPSRP